MKTFKNFSIFRSKPSDNEKAPTHRISSKDGEVFLDVGACWTKDTAKGDKFLSCSLNNIYVDHTDKTMSRDGFVIVLEKDLNKLLNEIKLLKGEALEEDIPEEDRSLDAF